MWWFQGMAMNGMHSVNYPTIYRSFARNFAFSTGLIPWSGLQKTIDSFRSHTGGNLTADSYEYLQNVTLVFDDGSSTSTTSSVARRGLELFIRDFSTTINGTTTGSDGNSTFVSSSKESHLVSGIQAYVEQLSIPDGNTFMTLFLVWAILIAAIVVGILLFKVVLEAWALLGSFPKSLTTFRKEYWRVMAQTITSLVLLLYGVWTLYCIFQFTRGDSWAAKVVAGVTLAIFTALLAFYTWQIISTVRKLKHMSGDAAALYENKETWKKYKIFYENYKKSYWWLFIPVIVYMFAKGCVLAAGDGHGMVQTIGQLAIEILMLGLLLWNRPYMRKSGNWINIIIQVVRVLSVVCILMFVEEFHVAQTTKTVTGVVLIGVQGGLTAVLAILIMVNSIIACCKENPHRKRRKAAEKAMSRDPEAFENDAFLTEPQPYKSTPPRQEKRLSGSTLAYEPYRGVAEGGAGIGAATRPETLNRFGLGREYSQDLLISSAASMGGKSGYRSVSQGRSETSRSRSPPRGRQPKLPDLDFDRHRGR